MRPVPDPARAWKRYKQQKAGGVDIDPSSATGDSRILAAKASTWRRYSRSLIETVPLKNRTTQRALANEVGLTQQRLQHKLKSIGLRAASRFLKPLLTEAGIQRRLNWALSFLRPGLGGTRKFDTMDKVVMVDEKWFFLKKNGQRYHLRDGEKAPMSKVQHESHMKKVTFLAVDGRPRLYIRASYLLLYIIIYDMFSTCKSQAAVRTQYSLSCAHRQEIC